jgi:hypothetical protein
MVINKKINMKIDLTKFSEILIVDENNNYIDRFFISSIGYVKDRFGERYLKISKRNFDDNEEKK